MFLSKVSLPKIDPVKELDKQLLQMKIVQNSYIAKLVESNFRTLLHESAQRYGSYVASWRVSLGRRSSASAHEEWPKLDPENWYHRGSAEAINWATKANADVWDEIVNYSINSRALYPNVVVYNNSPHADIGEGGPHRRENAGAAGAHARFESSLQADLNKMVIL